MKPLPLSDIIEINSHFGRSVNLERDFYSSVSIDSYIPTKTALASLERIAEAIVNPAATRAWTLTGPFGSGKSAFALFLAKILDVTGGPHSLPEPLQVALQTTYKKLRQGGDGAAFLPILISGAREPLTLALFRGIRAAVARLDPKVCAEHTRAIKRLEGSSSVTGKDILVLLSSISESLASTQKGAGVLLIVDELGKLLEFAAVDPAGTDIFLLQELAEGTRETSRPVLFISILHQAFERYAERLGERERDEWTKVQGRFEDVPFKEPFEQTLQIIRSVFKIDPQPLSEPIFARLGKSLGSKTYELGLLGGYPLSDALSLLRDCLPLHPLVACLLGPIFRKFGQNERSLFAFLTSSEPFGFAEFVRETTWTRDSQELVRLDRIYDYLVTSMGGTLISGPDGKRWAEVEAALLRIPHASELEVRTLKTIGLLYLLGEFGRFKASRALIEFSLVDDSVSPSDIDQAIQSLIQRSIITERRYNDTFVIWEGSDVDLDARFIEAGKNILPTESLATGLRQYIGHRPIVAKRHSARTGTLRSFNVDFLSASELDDLRESTFHGEGDAQIVFLLASSAVEQAKIDAKISGSPIPDVVFVSPPIVAGLKELMRRVACWRWVLDNTPQLEADRVAQKELAARLADAEHAVTEWLDDWFLGGRSATWFWRNQPRRFERARDLQEFLSTVMDELFPATPTIKNELVNRNILSSAAASARNSLLEAMLKNSTEAQLGISGYPPQLSMYFTLFQETTIHRVIDGTYAFAAPAPHADDGIRNVWKAIDDFLERSETEKLTVGDLFVELKAPPFGLRQGILPLITTAALLHYDSEVALYERGNFIPTLSMPVLERMCRAPWTFSIQLCRIAGIRSDVLSGLAGVFLPDADDIVSVDLLTIVRPLARFAQGLSEYSQNTSRLSPLARGVRRVLFSAREPSKLLFDALPEACGLSPFRANELVDDEKVRTFSRRLQRGLSELRRSYNELLNEIESQVSHAFAVPEGDLRESLRARSVAISGYAASVKLKGFLLRASDSKMDHKGWLESLGAQIVGRPPGSWRDSDLANFEVSLADIARSFASLESIVFSRLQELELGTESELIRINLTHIDGWEHSRVLSVASAEQEVISEAALLLREALDRSRINGNRNLRLAALARLSLELLKEDVESVEAKANGRRRGHSE